MNRPNTALLLALAAASLGLAACSEREAPESAAPEVLNFSILATENSTSLDTFWRPILADMEKEIGIPVKPFYGSNYTALIEALRFGQTDVAVSLHDAVKGSFRAASVAVSYNGDGWQLAGAVETVTSRTMDHHGINAKLGARFDIGRADFGVTWLHPEVNDKPDAIALDLVFPVSTKLDMMAFGEFTDGAKDDAYGIALDYKLRPDTSVLFAATDGRGGSAVHLTLERRF